jgi:hypothetical protein
MTTNEYEWEEFGDMPPEWDAWYGAASPQAVLALLDEVDRLRASANEAPQPDQRRLHDRALIETRMRGLANRWAFWSGAMTEPEAADFKPRLSPQLTTAERDELLAHVKRRLAEIEHDWTGHEPAMERVVTVLADELAIGGLSRALGILIDAALESS